jgi:hypothetical protein
MFDTCLLLSNTGHVVYDGPQKLVLDYMGALNFLCPRGENVADFLLDVTAGTAGGTSPALNAHEVGCPSIACS